MGLFGLKKSGSPGGAERVLAYLVDVQRQTAPLKIEDAQGHEVPATLQLVTHKRVGLTARELLDLDKGAHTHLVFILDGLRFKAPTRVLEVGPSGEVTLELPGAVHLAERRKIARGYLSAREGAAAMAMAGLFSPLAGHALASLGPSPAMVTGVGGRGAPGDGSVGEPLQTAGGPGMAGPLPVPQDDQPWLKTNLSLATTFRTSYVIHWLHARNITLAGHSTLSVVGESIHNACFDDMIHNNQPYAGPSTVRNALTRRAENRSLPCGITYTFMSRPLPEQWRRAFRMNSVKFEAYTTGNDLRLGIRIW